MLQFIQDNAVLCTCIVGVFTAVLSALVTLVVNRSTEKSKYIGELKNDIKEAKSELQSTQEKLKSVEEELEKYKSIEYAERNIDKRTGSIYTEKLPNGGSRDICGYCWEKNHITIPLITEINYDRTIGNTYEEGTCKVCKSYCREDYVGDDLPF